MKHTILVLALLLVFAIQPTYARSDKCKIEDWRFYNVAGILIIDGFTSCYEGNITIHAYDKENDNYLGKGESSITNHGFEVMILGVAQEPKSLRIKRIITRKQF